MITDSEISLSLSDIVRIEEAPVALATEPELPGFNAINGAEIIILYSC